MIEDVRAFQARFDQLVPGRVTHLTRRKLDERARFLEEELHEFRRATVVQDLEQQADALVDLVYVALGTAVMLGLPWDELWRDVHAANMRKVRGTTHRGNLKDVTKPPGWVGPDAEVILAIAGYDRDNFIRDGLVADDLCLDDPEHRA